MWMETRERLRFLNDVFVNSQNHKKKSLERTSFLSFLSIFGYKRRFSHARPGMEHGTRESLSL